MGIKITRTAVAAGHWPLDRPGHSFTLGQIERIAKECRAAGLPSDTVLTFSVGGATGAGMESAAFVLPTLELKEP